MTAHDVLCKGTWVFVDLGFASAWKFATFDKWETENPYDLQTDQVGETPVHTRTHSDR